jgi:hypothetical protein
MVGCQQYTNVFMYALVSKKAYYPEINFAGTQKSIQPYIPFILRGISM